MAPDVSLLLVCGTQIASLSISLFLCLVSVLPGRLVSRALCLRWRVNAAETCGVGTGRVTFVVNQPPAHPQLILSGSDNDASQPHRASVCVCV